MGATPISTSEGWEIETIDLIPGEEIYAVNLPHKIADCPYICGEILELSAKVFGGGFEPHVKEATAFLHMPAVASTLSLISSIDNNGEITITAMLSHKAKESMVVLLDNDMHILIKHGQKTGSIKVDAMRDESILKKYDSLYFQIKDVFGADQFEELNIDYAKIKHKMGNFFPAEM